MVVLAKMAVAALIDWKIDISLGLFQYIFFMLHSSNSIYSYDKNNWWFTFEMTSNSLDHDSFLVLILKLKLLQLTSKLVLNQQKKVLRY